MNDRFSWKLIAITFFWIIWKENYQKLDEPSQKWFVTSFNTWKPTTSISACQMQI